MGSQHNIAGKEHIEGLTLPALKICKSTVINKCGIAIGLWKLLETSTSNLSSLGDF
jgi:hypothetical protein